MEVTKDDNDGGVICALFGGGGGAARVRVHVGVGRLVLLLDGMELVDVGLRRLVDVVAVGL